jgi:hypothetical protein
MTDVEDRLRAESARLRAEYRGDSYMIPVDDLAVVLNPSREPEPAA